MELPNTYTYLYNSYSTFFKKCAVDYRVSTVSYNWKPFKIVIHLFRTPGSQHYDYYAQWIVPAVHPGVFRCQSRTLPWLARSEPIRFRRQFESENVWIIPNILSNISEFQLFAEFLQLQKDFTMIPLSNDAYFGFLRQFFPILFCESNNGRSSRKCSMKYYSLYLRVVSNWNKQI